MLSFTQKPIITPHIPSNKVSKHGRTHIVQNHQISSILQLQRESEDRLASQMLLNNTVKTDITSGNHSPGHESTDRDIQPSIGMSMPGDAYEQEAGQLADRILLKNISTNDNQQAEQVKKNLSTNTAKNDNSINNELKYRLSRSQGHGNPLPGEVQTFFRPRLKHDFNRVRIHDDHDSASMNRELGAKAFTFGQDIYFGNGKYKPHSSTGRHLLAHELVHVAQQRGRTDHNLLMRQPDLIEPAQETGDAFQIAKTQLTDSETSVMVKAMLHRESLRRGLIKLEKLKLESSLYRKKMVYSDPDVLLADNFQRLQRFDRRLIKLERNWRIAARKKLSIMLQGLRQLKQPGGTFGYMAYLNLTRDSKQNPESALIWMQVGNMLWSLGKKTTPSIRGPGYKKINYPRR